MMTVSEKCSNPIICNKHGFLVGLNEHADNIHRFFVADNPYDEDPIRDWFKIASGISKVEYFSARFDTAFMYCGPAIEYEQDKSKYHEILLLQLTLFTYIWGGFEAFTDSLELPSCPQQRGKINAVAHYLRNNYEPNFPLLAHYNGLLNLLKNYLNLNPWYGSTAGLFNPSQCSGLSGEALTIVYKIRNKFAHGSFIFSEPEEFNQAKPYDGRIIHISSRLTLLTIQMLLLAIHKDQPFFVEKRNESHEDGTLKSTDFLQQLHLREFET